MPPQTFRLLQQQAVAPLIPLSSPTPQHFVTLLVGNPAQPQELAVSTTSDHTSFPCMGCTNCRTSSGLDELFDYRRSSSATLPSCPRCTFPSSVCQDGSGDTQCHNVVASFNDGYGYRGFEVQDRVYLHSDDAGSIPLDRIDPQVTAQQGFPLDFMCQKEQLDATTTVQTRQNSDSQSREGFGFLAMSAAPSSFINQLHKSGRVSRNMFALCFRDISTQETSSATTAANTRLSAGQVTIGGHHEERTYDTPLVWALNSAPSQSLSGYTVNVRRIFLGVGIGNQDPLRTAARGTLSMLPIDEAPNMAAVDQTMSTATSSSSSSTRQQRRQGAQDSPVSYEEVNGRVGAVVIDTNQAKTVLPSSLQSAFRTAFQVAAGRDFNPNGLSTLTRDVVTYLPTVFLQLEVRLAEPHNHNSRFALRYSNVVLVVLLDMT